MSKPSMDESFAARVLDLQAETFHDGLEAGARRMAARANTGYLLSAVIQQMDVEFDRPCIHDKHGWTSDHRCARCGTPDPLGKHEPVGEA